jgi:hypothetical protein
LQLFKKLRLPAEWGISLLNIIRKEGVHGISRGFDALFLCEIVSLFVGIGVRNLFMCLPRPNLSDFEVEDNIITWQAQAKLCLLMTQVSPISVGVWHAIR